MNPPPPAFARRAVGAAAPGGGASTHYAALFNVTFRHDYYNAAGGACGDFRVIPTPACAKLMAALGMIFRDLGAGFSVQVDRARIPAMVAYLRQADERARSGAGRCTWLSFVLVLTNPDFVGITSLPITTSPMVQNLYATNLDAAEDGKGLVMGGGSGPGAALVPVTGASLEVPTPEGSTASLTDISGNAAPAAGATGDGVTRFSMNGLPYGFYTVVFEGAGDGGPPSEQYLYMPGQPGTFGLVDLVLAQPAAGQGVVAAFPVGAMAPPQSGASPSAPAVTTVNLTLPFKARKTYWNYYICSHDKSAHFTRGLQITGKGTAFDKSVETLPNGDPAVLFSARTPLPLQQVSEYRFELSGRRKSASGREDDISIDWLPASPAAPVWPASTGDALTGVSEIYVYV